MLYISFSKKFSWKFSSELFLVVFIALIDFISPSSLLKYFRQFSYLTLVLNLLWF